MDHFKNSMKVIGTDASPNGDPRVLQKLIETVNAEASFPQLVLKQFEYKHLEEKTSSEDFWDP